MNLCSTRSLTALALVLTACTAGTTSPPAPPPKSAPAGAVDLPPAPFSPKEATSVRLPEGAAPLRYDLTLRVDPRQRDFSGEAHIDVALAAPSDQLVLHARAMTIEGATVDGAPVVVKPRRAFGAKDDSEEIVLGFGKTLPAGEHAVVIRYTAPFNGQLRGLYKVERGGRSYAFTQLEAIDARRMFPGFDEPRFKTPFTLHVEVPEGMTAASNAPVKGAHGSAGKNVFDFETTPPLPTYLVALAVGDLEITEGPKDPVPIRMISIPGKGKLGGLALDAAAAYLKIFGAYFDRAYPYAKLDIVAVPDFGPGAMENPGLVTFREELLLLDPKRAPIWATRRMESVMAHELAHQWFGDLVTMQWWDDIWLNEGFATWMGTKAVDVRKPDTRAGIEQIGGKLNVMGTDALGAARPVRIPVATSDAILEASGWTAYVKGQAVLRMLEEHVGPEVFQDGLRAYIKSHEWGAVTSDDLVASLSKTSGKDLAPIARAFLDQPGVPLVEVDLACDAKGAKIKLRSGPFNAEQGETQQARSWTIPVCLKVEGVAQPVCTRLEKEASVDLQKCPKWIYPNAREQGYFRYALSPKDTSALASAAPKSLDESERAALISNTWALVLAKRLDVGAWLDVVTAMDVGNDRSRLVVEQTISILGSIRESLIDEKSLPAFQAFVEKLLSKALARLGDEPKATDTEDDRLLRIAVAGALFDLADDARVKAAAEKRVVAWLADSAAVDPDLATLSLRISSRARGAAKPEVLFDRLARAEASERVALVGALGSAGDPDAQRKALQSLVDGTIRAGDFRYLYTAAGRQPDSRKVFIDWILGHLPELRTKLGGVAGLVGLIGWTCDPAERARVSGFWKERLGSLEGAQRSFEEGTEASSRCIELRQREGEALSKWLDRSAKKRGAQ